MNDLLQEIAAGLLIVAAGAYFIIRSRRKSDCGCGSCPAPGKTSQNPGSRR